MRKLFKVLLCFLLMLQIGTAFPLTHHSQVLANSNTEEVPVNGTMMQYFEWYLPDSGEHWNQLGEDAEHLSEIGITSVWIPPAYKGHVGTSDVGYGVYDLYDLGEFNQKGTVRTKYGTKKQLQSAVDELHEYDIQVYGDVVVNHLMGADGIEQVKVKEVNPSNRNEDISGEFQKDVATIYNYDGRNNAHSSFKWRWQHFDGIDDWGKVYRFIGDNKGWDWEVSTENGNYDYLMGADLDFDHPEVVNEIKNWGVWYANELDLDGYRLDAVKHIKYEFMETFVEHARNEIGKEMFAVGEYIGGIHDLENYLNKVNYSMSLFDFPLRNNFAQASSSNGHFDLRKLTDQTLIASSPMNAVTFVENHDTQPDRDDAHGAAVLEWFKPLAYAFTLTREQGYPAVFYGDYYGTNGASGKKINPLKEKLDPILLARKNQAYGTQHDYLDHEDLIGWTREGVVSKPGSGLATVMTDKQGGSKQMYVGTHHAGETWYDLTGNIQETVTIDQSGNGVFKVKDGSVSIWVPEHQDGDDSNEEGDDDNQNEELPTLPTPTELQASENNGIIELSWKQAGDSVDTYEIYRNDKYIGQANTLNYRDESINRSGKYTYKVRAKGADGNHSLFSDGVTIQVQISNDDGNTEPQPIDDTNFSWDNANVYFVLTDRFNNGNPNNDQAYGRPQVDAWGTNIGTFHGGDIKGLTEKLKEGYFTELGTNAIWISAPWEQMHGWVGGKDGDFAHYGYHGYYALDFTSMDQSIGTIDEMREFVDLAHEKGIRVVLDVVMNHVAYPTLVDMEKFSYGDSGGLSGDWVPNENKGENWHTHNDIMDKTNEVAWASWWGKDWIRADGTAGYDNCGGGDIKMCVGFLPDVKTEVTKGVNIPPILQNKWSQEQSGFDQWIVPTAKQYRKNLNIAPKDYIIKWLGAWVEEFGIDGFRVDTAKHVEIDRWAELKNEAKTALENWRANNPDKPGANWSDDFWMTAEVFGHGLGKSEYFDHGFDSVINFEFQEANKKDLEGLFSRYANQINSDPNFNVLSYISSHDTSLHGRDDLIQAGTALLLLPGAIQTFYGDETARPLGNGGSDPEQGTRSFMNWDNINEDVLSHWKKLGQFRNNHLAIGAGQHEKLAESPYTFARTYESDELIDQVVVATGVSGTKEITVGDIFGDGEEVRDAYTGNVTTVNGGKATFTAGKNGIVLIESTSEPKRNLPIVSSSKESGVFKTDELSVSLHVEKAEIGKYTLDGSNPEDGIEFTDGTEITIGAESDFGETIILKIFAENENGTITKTYEYRKKDPNDLLEVYFKKPENWSAPAIYYYETDQPEDEPTWATAPLMTDVGEGWYQYIFEEAEEAKVIFKDQSGHQMPGQSLPGYEITETSWFDGEKWYDTDPRQPLDPATRPENLQVIDITDRTVSLQWDSSSGYVVEYIIYRNGEEIALSTESSFIDNELQAETTYSYYVVAKGANNHLTEASNTVEATTLEKVAGNQVTVYYQSGYDTPYVHYRPEGGQWTAVPGVPMELSTNYPGYYEMTVDIGEASFLEVAFNDGRGNWDSNREQNYLFEVGENTYKPGVNGQAGKVTKGKPN